MARVAYVNGQYVPFSRALIHVEDRGFQFADGVYEVIAVKNQILLDSKRHFDRLSYSLSALSIKPALSIASLKIVLDQIILRNKVINGIVYLQMTRGVAKRDHAFPDHTKTSLVITARASAPRSPSVMQAGVSVITVKDIRWQRCDIKSISLLPNVLAKQEAKRVGAYEAWMIDGDGFVTEGSSTNAWILSEDGELITRHLDTSILAGVTRLVVRDIALKEKLNLVERPFTAEEAKKATEAFLTSTTSFVTPVTKIDGALIGTGEVGRITRSLNQLYFEI